VVPVFPGQEGILQGQAGQGCSGPGSKRGQEGLLGLGLGKAGVGPQGPGDGPEAGFDAAAPQGVWVGLLPLRTEALDLGQERPELSGVPLGGKACAGGLLCTLQRSQRRPPLAGLCRGRQHLRAGRGEVQPEVGPVAPEAGRHRLAGLLQGRGRIVAPFQEGQGPGAVEVGQGQVNPEVVGCEAQGGLACLLGGAQVSLGILPQGQGPPG